MIIGYHSLARHWSRPWSPRHSAFSTRRPELFTAGSEGDCTLTAEEKHAVNFSHVLLILLIPFSWDCPDFSQSQQFIPLIFLVCLSLQAWSFCPSLHVVRITGSCEKQCLLCLITSIFPHLTLHAAYQTLPHPRDIRCQTASPQAAMAKNETRFPLSFPAIPFIIVLKLQKVNGCVE